MVTNEGYRVILNFTAFLLEEGYDYLYFGDGIKFHKSFLRLSGFVRSYIQKLKFSLVVIAELVLNENAVETYINSYSHLKFPQANPHTQYL